MKILQINKFLYPVGGSETYMFQLSNGLKDLGHEIAFWGMQDDRNIVEDEHNCFAENVDYHQLRSFDKFKKSISTIYSKTNKNKIGIMLDQFEPDVVHIHNYNFQLTPSILEEIKERKIKIVQTTHDSQMVCPWHRLYNFQQDNVCTKCVEGSFFNCIKDKCFDDSLLKSTIGAAESMFYHSRNYYNKYIDAFISPSKFLAALLQKRINQKIHVVPNFVVLESHLQPSLKSNDYILYFGRISKEKGILDIQRMFDQLKTKLVIVGTGPNVDDLLETEYIQYVGPKYGEELLNYIKDAKFVIQPSKWYENCPMTVIEAFACGTPVIASNHSGFTELIINGQNGYLIDFTKTDVVNNLTELIKRDNPNMRSNCIESYKSNYTKEIHISKILDIYNQVINEGL